MAIQNVIGDAARGATWVSIHNGGGVGWGEVINGGFGFVLDGTKAGMSSRALSKIDNGILDTGRAMDVEPLWQVTKINVVDDDILNTITNETYKQ